MQASIFKHDLELDVRICIDCENMDTMATERSAKL
jgi:hypothetical protein